MSSRRRTGLPSARPALAWAAAAFLALSTAGCDGFAYPRDPDGTLDQVIATKRMRVAAVDHDPWIILDAQEAPQGVEAELVRGFAEALGVRIEWLRLPAFEALQGLDRGEVDLALGGFTKEAVKMHKASSSYDYFTDVIIVAAAPGVTPTRKLEGRRVETSPDLFVQEKLREKGAIPVEDGGDFIAMPAWRAAALNLASTGVVLRKSHHVVALPAGENAWVMRFETYLRRAADDLPARLARYAQPARAPGL